MLCGQMTWQIVANGPAPVTGWLSPRDTSHCPSVLLEKHLWVGCVIHPETEIRHY